MRTEIKVHMSWLFLISCGIVSAFALEEKCLCAKKDVTVLEEPKHFGKQIGTLKVGSCIRSSEYETHGRWLKLMESGFVWSGLFEIGGECGEQEDMLIQKRNHHTQCANCYRTCPCEQRNTDYCAAHCNYCIPDLHCPAEQWSDWGDCSKTCGGGTRSRSCIAHCGTAQHTDEIQECNNHTCPHFIHHTIHHSTPEWSDWGDCSKTCGGGTRSRSCIAYCSTAQHTDEIQECNSHTCPHFTHHTIHHSTPVDGQWSPWSNTTQCSVTCGTGWYHVSRTCIYRDPHNKGKPCQGHSTETQRCSHQCAVDGQWSAWRPTTQCSVTCGTGWYHIGRTCIYHDLHNRGQPCQGHNIETRACTHRCPVDGQWSEWRNATQCSVTCGTGWYHAERTCIYHDPHNKGQPCQGDHVERRTCTNQCPVHIGSSAVDGQWSAWRNATQCSVSCGTGTYRVTRSCIYKDPHHRGRPCQGPYTETLKCTHPCPVDGQWSSWRPTTQCSVTCGTGLFYVARSCIYKDPHNKGQPCQGDNLEKRTCSHQCPVDGQWSAWRNTTQCSVTCGTGWYNAERTCIYKDPHNKGQPCQGDNLEKRTCSHQCPVDGQWSNWRNDTNCSATCGTRWYRQIRTCNYPDPHNKGKPCHGIHTYNKPCTVHCPEYHCDKLKIFHEIAEQATTNKTLCDNRRNTSSEEFVFDNCDVPRDPQLWKEGRIVYDLHHHNCSDIPMYTPVGFFPFKGRFTSGSFSGVAGVFVGCLDDFSGIKIATKLCDGIAEVIHIPSARHSVLASNGFIPQRLNLFFTISS